MATMVLATPSIQNPVSLITRFSKSEYWGHISKRVALSIDDVFILEESFLTSKNLKIGTLGIAFVVMEWKFVFEFEFLWDLGV